MAESLQDLLQKAWRGGREGYLSALEEARAWALREVWQDDDKVRRAGGQSENCFEHSLPRFYATKGPFH